MKPKKLPIHKRLLNSYKAWKSMRNQKILNKLDAYSMGEAIRLANRKRDILNNTTWVIGGSGGEFLVFSRYQKQSLQSQGLLKSPITGKELNEKASYIALPYTNKDHRRGGIIRKFLGDKK